MPKCAGQSAGDFEAELLPKTDRSGICGNHEIELHGAKTEPARFVQTMLGHRTTDALPPSACCNHESCVGDVRTATCLVRSQQLCSIDPAVRFRDVCARAGSKPVRQRIIARDV